MEGHLKINQQSLKNCNFVGDGTGKDEETLEFPRFLLQW